MQSTASKNPIHGIKKIQSTASKSPIHGIQDGSAASQTPAMLMRQTAVVVEVEPDGSCPTHTDTRDTQARACSSLATWGQCSGLSPLRCQLGAGRASLPPSLPATPSLPPCTQRCSSFECRVECETLVKDFVWAVMSAHNTSPIDEV